MRPRRVLCVLMASTWFLMGASVPAVAEAEDLQWGYWWMAQQGVSRLPPPPQVPSGGLYVSASPAGLTAISAVAFQTPADAVDPKLVLQVASLQAAGEFSVAAYPAKGSWAGAAAGTWSERPAYGAPGVVGVISADQKTITFDMSPLRTGTTVSVVIAPAPSSTGQYPAVDMAFQQPTPADISGVSSTRGEQSIPRTSASETGTDFSASPPGAVAGLPSAALSGATVGSTPTGRYAGPVPPVVAPRPNFSGTVPSAVSAPLVSTGGRSTRQTLILAFLLANTLTYLLQRGRAGRTSEISIYDLPEPSGSGQGADHDGAELGERIA